MNRITLLNLFVAAFLIAGAMAAAEDATAPAPDDAAAHAAAPAAASPTLFPVPDYTGSLSQRLCLTGDWGGARTQLANHGVQARLGLTQVYQGIARGGLDTRPEYGGWANLELDFDFQKLGLWPGGFLMLRLDANYEDGINPHTGALLPANINALFPVPGEETITLSDVMFTQFLSHKLAVFFGKFDTVSGDMNDFAHGRGDQQFLNTAFSLNPVGGICVPYSTLGAGFIVLPTHNLHVSFSAFDSRGKASTSGFDSLFDGNVTYSLEGRLKTNFFGKTGHQLLGGGYSTADFTNLETATEIDIPFFNGRRRPTPVANAPARMGLRLASLLKGDSDKESGTWYLFYNFDQYFMQSAEDPTQGLGIFGRFGTADGDTNPIQYFYSLGFGGKGMIPGRPNDRYGIGYYYLQTSNRLNDALDIGDEQGCEIYYNFAVTRWMQITPDLQIINPASKNNDTTVVAGLRCHLSF